MQCDLLWMSVRTVSAVCLFFRETLREPDESLPGFKCWYLWLFITFPNYYCNLRLDFDITLYYDTEWKRFREDDAVHVAALRRRQKYTTANATKALKLCDLSQIRFRDENTSKIELYTKPIVWSGRVPSTLSVVRFPIKNQKITTGRFPSK